MEYKLKEGHVEQLKVMIKEAYGAHVKNEKYTAYQKKDMKTILQWVLECVQYSDIITLFDIRRYGNEIQRIIILIHYLKIESSNIM